MLEQLLAPSLWRNDLEYVFVVRRGSVERSNLWAKDGREIEADANDMFHNDIDANDAELDDGRIIRLSTPLRLALEVSPPQEGFLSFDGKKEQGPAWKGSLIANCADLVQLLVGEVELAGRA